MPTAEAALLAAYRSGRMPHAFLIAGPKGIGKATLAYRMARFVLAHPDPAAREVQAAASLAVAADHPVARRIAAQAQPDLLILERTLNDKGVLRNQIAVEDIRRTVGFFGSTAGEGGWRDCHRRCGRRVEPVRRQCAPQGAGGAAAARAALPHQPFGGARAGRRCARAAASSRCGRSPKPTLPRRVAAATGSAADDPQIAAAAAAAEGSVSRALALLDEGALGAPPAGAHAARPPAGARHQGAACARRGARRHRSAAACRLRRYRECLAVAARRLGRRPKSGGLPVSPRPGSASTRPRATPRPTISSESRWFSTSSACLPRPRAVDTNPHVRKTRFVRQALLHHHRDRLSERRAAYRACL